MISEKEAVLLIIAVCAGIALLVTFITAALVWVADRRRKNHEQKQKRQ